MGFSYHKALFIAILPLYCVLAVGASQSHDQRSELNDLKKQVADLQQRLADQEYNLVSVSVSQYEVHQQNTEHTHMQNALMEQLNRTCQRILKKTPAGKDDMIQKVEELTRKQNAIMELLNRTYETMMKRTSAVLRRDCADLYNNNGATVSGVYTIHPTGLGAIEVYCDMVTDGGGWTVFQRRQDGSVDFYLDWAEYRTGFGDLRTEFWLGNDKIHRLTSQASYNLRVDLEDFDNTKVYAVYDSFSVGSEEEKYNLTIGSYSGTAGDSLTSYHNGRPFSTKDRDNDGHPGVHCATDYKGAWWYSGCHRSNLNGDYGNNNRWLGVNWYKFKGDSYSLKRTSMMMRPVGFKSNK